MFGDGIFNIAAINGWQVSTGTEHGKPCLYFQRQTINGVPFCLTTELTDGGVGEVVREILLFVCAFDPEICAREWMIRTGKISRSSFHRTVADLENVRRKAWLLACALDAFSEDTEVMPFFPSGGMS